MPSTTLPPPSKAWGQNYLQNRGVIRRIVEQLEARPGDRILEIGGGRGALTMLLAELPGCEVTVLEPHPPSFENLCSLFSSAPNVTILKADATTVDFSSFQAHLTVGNLPYNVSSRILTALLRTGRAQRRWVLMFQREMAQRIVSGPNSKNFGALSVAVQAASVPKIVFNVSPGSFYPPPKVESSVVAFTPLEEGDLFVSEESRVFLQDLFGFRRKTLQRSLTRLLGEEGALRCLTEVGVDGTKRPENLTLEEFKLLISSALHYRRLCYGDLS